MKASSDNAVTLCELQHLPHWDVVTGERVLLGMQDHDTRNQMGWYIGL
jgi:hypothetical protein